MGSLTTKVADLVGSASIHVGQATSQRGGLDDEMVERHHTTRSVAVVATTTEVEL